MASKRGLITTPTLSSQYSGYGLQYITDKVIDQQSGCHCTALLNLPVICCRSYTYIIN